MATKAEAAKLELQNVQAELSRILIGLTPKI